MGRYYDDKISLAGLDPANPSYQTLINAANAVDRAESNWYERRREGFDQLDFGDFNKSKGDVERKYAELVSGLSVYDFKSTFDRVGPSRKNATGVFRFVHNTFTNQGITDGYSTERYEEGEEDDDGNIDYVISSDVLNYHVGRGKGNADTLYDDLKAFRTSSLSSKNFYRFDDDDEDPGFVRVSDVFKGFGEVPIAWKPKSGYSPQQLQVMNAAGTDYNLQVGPVIEQYKNVLDKYNKAGGGPLEFIFYDGGTPDFIYENFQGKNTSYNRPNNLESELIKETRGFGS